MSDSALSSVVGLIPVAIASGIAIKTTKALHPKEKTKRAKVERKLKRKKKARRVKSVTKSRRKSRQDIDKWIG